MTAPPASRRWIVPGALLAGVVVLGVACCVVIKCGLVLVNADAAPAVAEAWAARTVLDATIERRASELRNPLPASGRTIQAGMHLYKQDCEICHGGADGRASTVAHGLYQKPPQFGDGSMSGDPENTTYCTTSTRCRAPLPLNGEPFDETDVAGICRAPTLCRSDPRSSRSRARWRRCGGADGPTYGHDRETPAATG